MIFAWTEFFPMLTRLQPESSFWTAVSFCPVGPWVLGSSPSTDRAIFFSSIGAVKRLRVIKRTKPSFRVGSYPSGYDRNVDPPPVPVKPDSKTRGMKMPAWYAWTGNLNHLLTYGRAMEVESGKRGFKNERWL